MHSQKHHDAVVAANHKRKGKKHKSSRSGYIYVNNGLIQHQIDPKELNIWINKGFKKGGLPKSESHRHNISKSLKNYERTPEHCANISKANSGPNHWCYGHPEINPMYGKHQSDHAKKLISLAMSGENHPLYGTHLSESTKRKISKSNQGKKIPKESSQRGAAKRRGRKQSLETRKKRSVSMSIAIANSDPGKFQSKQELECINYLSNYFLVKPQYRIKGIHYPHPYDMYVLLPNGIQLLIEFDGNYWHRNTDYNHDLREYIANLYGYAYIVIKGNDYKELGKILVKESVIAFCPEVEHYKLADAPLIKPRNVKVKPIKYNKDVFLNLIM